MLLGYLIIRALRNLIRVFGRLPDPASRAWARFLNTATTPFDIANYLGSRAGGTVLGRRAQAACSTASSQPCTGASTPKPTPNWAAACTTPPAGTRSSPTT